MKSYEEVIERAGWRIYGSYMSGSSEYHKVVDCEEIAFIFEKAESEVSKDCEKAFFANWVE